jgi:hypothetical protein
MYLTRKQTKTGYRYSVIEYGMLTSGINWRHQYVGLLKLHKTCYPAPTTNSYQHGNTVKKSLESMRAAHSEAAAGIQRLCTYKLKASMRAAHPEAAASIQRLFTTYKLKADFFGSPWHSEGYSCSFLRLLTVSHQKYNKRRPARTLQPNFAARSPGSAVPAPSSSTLFPRT